jgi:uncharacterized protein DUF4349
MFNFIRSFDRKSTFAAGFVCSFLLFALIILVQLANRDQGIAKQKSTALSAVNSGVDWTNPYSEWRSGPRLLDAVFPLRSPSRMYHAGGIVLDQSSAPRKIVSTGTLWLSVNDPIHAIDEISGIAQQYGGYITTQQNQIVAVTGAEGTLTLRLPAEGFDEVRRRIKAFALHVDQEQTTANDVTKDYVDFEARLRTLRAQEEQYLKILRSAKTVEDTLKVTERLTGVRSEMERAQGEFNFLQRTVETSLLEVHLQLAPGGRFASLDWHPGLRVKEELREGIEAVGIFFGVLLSILVHLPAILLWVLTIAALCALAWRLCRVLWRWFVPVRHTATPA